MAEQQQPDDGELSDDEESQSLGESTQESSGYVFIKDKPQEEWTFEDYVSRQ